MVRAARVLVAPWRPVYLYSIKHYNKPTKTAAQDMDSIVVVLHLTVFIVLTMCAIIVWRKCGALKAQKGAICPDMDNANLPTLDGLGVCQAALLGAKN